MKVQGSPAMGPTAPASPAGLAGLPNGAPGGVDMGIVDQIMAIDKGRIADTTAKRDNLVQEKNAYSSVTTALGALATQLGSMSSAEKFQKLKVESSDPDVIGAEMVASTTGLKPGNYSLEVSGLASSSKHLDQGFPDSDKTAVGFGYLAIGRGDGQADLEVTIDPGATLDDVAARINQSGGGVQASVINTGSAEDPFKLMVRSEKTGEISQINIDPDSTFLNFKEIAPGKNLAMKFEGVDVSRSENSFSDLIDGVKLTAKKSMPGTVVSLNVTQDTESTAVGIKDFVSKYNSVRDEMAKQINPTEGQRATLGTASSMRQAMRSLQAGISSANNFGGNDKTLASVGISTNAKTGDLEVNEAQLKQALENDYVGVMNIFASSEGRVGLAEQLGNAVKSLQDRNSGVMPLRQKSLEQQIRQQDQTIERQQRLADEKHQRIQKVFSDLNSKLQAMTSQQQAMSARLIG